MKKLIFNILLTVVTLGIFTGCDDDREPTSEILLYDIVKLEAQDDNGSVFTVQKPDAEEVVTLTAPRQMIDLELVPVGNRLFLAYVPESGIAYKSDKISIKGYSLVTNIKMTDDKMPEKWDRDPVYLLAAWRSGCYLNMRLKLPATDTPRTFALVRDTNNGDPMHPDLYLCHALREDINTYDKVYYVSFDITDLVEDSNINGFTLHLNDVNLNLKTIEYNLQR